MTPKLVKSDTRAEILSITLKLKGNKTSDRKLPWFDAEIHKICLKKERLRSLYKDSKNPEH